MSNSNHPERSITFSKVEQFKRVLSFFIEHKMYTLVFTLLLTFTAVYAVSPDQPVVMAQGTVPPTETPTTRPFSIIRLNVYPVDEEENELLKDVPLHIRNDARENKDFTDTTRDPSNGRWGWVETTDEFPSQLSMEVSSALVASVDFEITPADGSSTDIITGTIGNPDLTGTFEANFGEAIPRGVRVAHQDGGVPRLKTTIDRTSITVEDLQTNEKVKVDGIAEEASLVYQPAVEETTPPVSSAEASTTMTKKVTVILGVGETTTVTISGTNGLLFSTEMVNRTDQQKTEELNLVDTDGDGAADTVDDGKVNNPPEFQLLLPMIFSSRQ